MGTLTMSLWCYRVLDSAVSCTQTLLMLVLLNGLVCLIFSTIPSPSFYSYPFPSSASVITWKGLKSKTWYESGLFRWKTDITLWWWPVTKMAERNYHTGKLSIFDSSADIEQAVSNLVFSKTSRMRFCRGMVNLPFELRDRRSIKAPVIGKHRPTSLTEMKSNCG